MQRLELLPFGYQDELRQLALEPRLMTFRLNRTGFWVSSRLTWDFGNLGGSHGRSEPSLALAPRCPRHRPDRHRRSRGARGGDLADDPGRPRGPLEHVARGGPGEVRRRAPGHRAQP